MPASGPFGKWTVADLAEELGVSLNYFRQIVNEKGAPPLVPDVRAGNLNLYGDETAEKWLSAYRRYRDEAPARAAARRAAAEAQADFERDREIARLRTEFRVADSMQAATDELLNWSDEQDRRWHATGGKEGEPK